MVGPGACRPATSCVGPLFHKAKGPAPFHSIEGVDKFVSIEDRDEPVHCLRGVKWTRRVVISEDAPGILHRSQYSLLIAGRQAWLWREIDAVKPET